VINIKEESEMADKSCILNLLNIKKKINKNMKIAKNSKTMSECRSLRSNLKKTGTDG